MAAGGFERARRADKRKHRLPIVAMGSNDDGKAGVIGAGKSER